MLRSLHILFGSRILIIFILASLISCSSMRMEYGFNIRNKTHKTKTITRYENGKIKKIEKTKFIYPNGIIDANFYKKIRIKSHDVNGIIRSDLIEERIGSGVWGNETLRGIYKYYLENGEVKIDTVYYNESGW
jgi:antitoxin component YwqK of YwqJK toxin-antitoxin module